MRGLEAFWGWVTSTGAGSALAFLVIAALWLVSWVLFLLELSGGR